MKCVGALGELAGYSAGFTWQFPVVQRDRELEAPVAKRWTAVDLAPIGAARRHEMVPIDPAIEIREGDLVLVRGAVYAEHQARASVAPGVKWSNFTSDFDLAVASIDLFDSEEQRIRDLASTAFWRALVTEDHDRCRSALRLLQVNGQLDRVMYLVLRATMHARFADPVAMDRVVGIARARAGLSPSDLLDAARSLLESLQKVSPSVDLADLEVRAVQALAELSPVIYLPDYSQRRRLSELVDMVLHQVEKSAKQERPIELRARQVKQGQRLSPVALALLAHLLGHDAKGHLVLDTVESPARNVLERTGVLDLTDRGALPPQPELPVGHVVLRDSVTAFHVTEFHRSPERTYRTQLVDSDITRWLRLACAATGESHLNAISRAIGHLLDNVRSHAYLTRSETSRSGIYLSITQGGGDESTNRLSIIVFDNGVGLRAALEKECGVLDSSTPDLVRWLFTEKTVTGGDGSALENIGTGFRELVAVLRRFTDYAQSRSDVSARSHLNVISSSRVEGGTEIIVADVLNDPPLIEDRPSPSGATGTTIVLSIPLARSDLELHPTSTDSDYQDGAPVSAGDPPLEDPVR